MDVTNDTVNASKLLLGETATKNDGTKITGTLSSSNITVDMEWINVYSRWQAGYYYDPDNNYAYTQIPSTERSWGETETYIAVSCTPYSNMIPVVEGEQYRYYNMPVHFDSKNAEIPGVILFNSSKVRVASYTRTYQDEGYTEITIPSGAVWMAVIYANSQDYVLQKRIVKIHDATDIAARVAANYRTYSLQTPPTTRTLDKAYFCVGSDDLRPWETKAIHTLYSAQNIPYYIAAIPQQVKACITDDPYKTNYDYIQLCVAAGGEIVCHSNPWLTNSNAEDFDTLYQYFVANKEELEAYGFTVHGIFKAGGDGAINNADSRIDAWAAYYYDYSDTFGSNFPYDHLNRQFFEWISTSTIDSIVNNAITNHSYGIFATHEVNSDTQTNFTYLMNKLSSYTRGTDYDFITPYELYQKLMPV